MMETIWFAISFCNLVLREVLATLKSRALSISALSLKVSKKRRVSFFANSYPSVMTLGCRPSWISLYAYFMSSPMNKTLEVVPSPTISSWAVAALAIIDAVG
jgi:hypothetical protein